MKRFFVLVLVLLLLGSNGLAAMAQDPTDEATPEPSVEATEEPTEEATEEPTEEATEEPTEEATEEPTEEATDEPTLTVTPTEELTPTVTVTPTEELTPTVTVTPTEELTPTATVTPTQELTTLEDIGSAAVNTGEGNTDLYLMDASGAGNNTITVEYFQKGSTSAAATKAIVLNNPYASTKVAADDVAGLGDGFEGRALVSASNKVAVAGTSTWPTNTRAGTYTGFSEGAGTVYMPFIPFYPGVIEWEVSVYNVGSTNTSVNLKFYNTEGTKDHEQNISVNAGDQKIVTSSVKDWTKTSYFTDHAIPGVIPGYWYGSLVASTSPDTDIVAVVTVHFGKESVQFGSVLETDTKVFLPHLRRDRASHDVSQPAIFNPSGSPVDITVKFYSDQSSSVKMTHTETIPGHGMASLFLKPSTFNDLGNNWKGSATVESSGPIAAVVDHNYKFSPFGGSYADWRSRAVYAAHGSSAATNECFIPTGQRLFVDINNFYWTEFALQNPSTSSTATFSIEYYNRNGTKINGNWPAGGSGDPFKNLTLGPEVGRFDGTAGKTMGQQYVGNDWEGGIRITSNQPLLCVGEFNKFSINTLATVWHTLHGAQNTP